MKKTFTLLEVEAMVNNAKRDVELLNHWTEILNVIPLKIPQEVGDYLVNNWPPPKEMMDSRDFCGMKDFWLNKIKAALGEATSSIKRNEAWLEKAKSKGVRSTLTKKEQRKRGMLPPI